MEPDAAKLLQNCTGIVTCALEFHALRDARTISRVTESMKVFFEILQIQLIFSIKRLMPSEDKQFMISENILIDTCTSYDVRCGFHYAEKLFGEL